MDVNRSKSDEFMGCISLDSYLKYAKQLFNTDFEIKSEDVPIMSLYITQPNIEKKKYDTILNGQFKADDPVTVVQGIEKRFLVVGHTRTRVEYEHNNIYVKANVLYPNTMRLEEALEEENLRLRQNCRTGKIDSIKFC